MKINTLKSLLLATGLLAPFATSSADIAIYYEVNGTYLPALDGSGNLSGGAFNGLNTTAFNTSNYMGVENGYFAATNGAGVNEYYAYVAGGPASIYGATGLGSTLIGGNLAGQSVNNANYLGTTTALSVYADATGINTYSYLNTHYFDYQWTTLSGGNLNGQAPTAGIGLRDFAGNTEMNDLFLLNVENDGTLGYYDITTGAYNSVLDLSYGSWSTFNSGPLAGLTLTQLAANPTGTANGNNYRFLGTYDDAIVFEVPGAVVPEPSGALCVALVGLAVIVRRRRFDRI